MVTFTEELRVLCRQCRGKLPTPPNNEREAFCSSDCDKWFFRVRCRCGIAYCASTPFMI
jgi:hypothetical protein